MQRPDTPGEIIDFDSASQAAFRRYAAEWLPKVRRELDEARKRAENHYSGQTAAGRQAQ